MSDNYQAIFDAVRSKLSNCDVGAAVQETAFRQFDISWDRTIIRDTIIGHANTIADEMTRPSVLFKPLLSIDGNMWCALLGEDLQSGLGAFGKTPDDAMRNFDAAFKVTLAPFAHAAPPAKIDALKRGEE